MAYIDTNSINPNDESSKDKVYDESGFVPCSEEIYTYLTKGTSLEIDQLYSYRKPVNYFPGTKNGVNIIIMRIYRILYLIIIRYGGMEVRIL